MRIPFIALLFQGIPEQIAVVSLAFVIAKIPLDWKRIILIGTILGSTAYIVRLLPIPFGVHTVLLIILLFISLIALGKVDISLSFLSSLLSFLCLAILEFMSISILMPIYKITPEIVVGNPVIRILIGEPHVLLIFLLAFIIHYFRKRGHINEFLRKYQS